MEHTVKGIANTRQTQDSERTLLKASWNKLITQANHMRLYAFVMSRTLSKGTNAIACRDSLIAAFLRSQGRVNACTQI